MRWRWTLWPSSSDVRALRGLSDGGPSAGFSILQGAHGAPSFFAEVRMVPVSVLLVEDNEDILANLYAYLEPLGYELDCARNGRTGLEMAASGQFDLVVLDIMLPGLDGISLCRALREEHGVQVPVIMLTARDTVADRVLGLDAGADDYLVKPFALRELEARIRALLRRGRTQESAQGGELRVDDVCIDVAGHRVTRQGREVKVSPTGFRILCELARRAPALVRREELERRLWGDDLPGGSALRTHIHELRQHLDKPFGSPVLHTISHVGYRLGREEESGA